MTGCASEAMRMGRVVVGGDQPGRRKESSGQRNEDDAVNRRGDKMVRRWGIVAGGAAHANSDTLCVRTEVSSRDDDAAEK